MGVQGFFCALNGSNYRLRQMRGFLGHRRFNGIRLSMSASARQKYHLLSVVLLDRLHEHSSPNNWDWVGFEMPFFKPNP